MQGLIQMIPIYFVDFIILYQAYFQQDKRLYPNHLNYFSKEKGVHSRFRKIVKK